MPLTEYVAPVKAGKILEKIDPHKGHNVSGGIIGCRDLRMSDEPEDVFRVSGAVALSPHCLVGNFVVVYDDDTVEFYEPAAFRTNFKRSRAEKPEKKEEVPA